MNPPIRYKRKGRRLCSRGTIIERGALGTFKVLPLRRGWHHVIVTQDEIDAANPAMHRIAKLRHAPGWEGHPALALLEHFCSALARMERRRPA